MVKKFATSCPFFADADSQKKKYIDSKRDYDLPDGSTLQSGNIVDGWRTLKKNSFLVKLCEDGGDTKYNRHYLGELPYFKRWYEIVGLCAVTFRSVTDWQFPGGGCGGGGRGAGESTFCHESFDDCRGVLHRYS